MSQQKTPIHQPKKRRGKNKQQEKKTRFDSLCQCTHLRNRFGAAHCQMDSCFKWFEPVYPCVFSFFTLGEIVQFDSARCSKMAEETPTSHAFNCTKGCKLFYRMSNCHIAMFVYGSMHVSDVTRMLVHHPKDLYLKEGRSRVSITGAKLESFRWAISL